MKRLMSGSGSKRAPIYLVCHGRGSEERWATEPLPIGLLYVGQALVDAGWRVRVLHLQGENDASLRQAVAEERPLFVGFSNFVSPTLRHHLRLSKWLTAAGIKVVWGGIFPTTLPLVPLASDCVDYIVMGEGEQPAVELAEAIAAGEPPRGIAGVGYRDGEEMVLNPADPPSLDLDRHPLGLDLIDRERYIQYDPYRRKRLFRVPFSRGCPFRCKFCYNSVNPNRQVWRCHSHEYMVDMIEYLRKKHDIGILGLVSDNPFGNPEGAKRALSDLGIMWTSLIHINHVNADLIDWALANQCKKWSMGLESGSDRVLREVLGKTFNQEMILSKLALCRDKGLDTTSSWMGMIPGETREELRESFVRIDEICRRDPYHGINFNIFCSFPQTPMWDVTLALGHPDPVTLEGWGDYHAEVYHLLGYTSAEVRRMQTLVQLLYPLDRALDRRLAGPLRPARALLRRRLFAGRVRLPLEEAARAGWQVVKAARKIAAKGVPR
jgi:anaerobic magnesium-protoporphyrin IX monomethyl ester cyclase